MFTAIHTDDGIIRRVLRGNHDAFRVLLDRYGNIVYGVAFARTGNAADAEDVTQETFLRLYQWLDRIVGRATVGPWLVEVARNTANDVLRRRQRETALPAPDHPVAARDFARDELRRMVWEQLAGLDDTHREVIILHYFQSVKIREIARLLGITPDAAKKRLQRSRDELGKRLLSEVGEETAARPASERNRKVMAAIAAAPPAWQPSPALSLAAAAIVGASAAKIVTATAAAAILIAVGLYAGWRHANRPYDTQDITAQSTFEQNATEIHTEPAHAAQPAATIQAQTPPASDESSNTAAPYEAAVYGLVLDKTLRPVPAATVRFTNAQAVSELEATKKTQFSPFTLDPAELQTTSGDDGAFYFDQVPTGGDAMVSTFHVTGEKGNLFGEAGFRCPAGIREHYVELIVEPAVELALRVIDESGAGIPGANVVCFPSNDMMRSRPRFVTGHNGSIDILRLVPGMYDISADCYGYAQVSAPHNLTAGKQTVILTLGEGASLSGRLTFAGDRSPIPDVTVATYCPDRREPVAKTDADGNFFMKGLDTDLYEFRMGKDSAPYVIIDSPRVRVTEGVPVTGVEIQAVEGAYVSGTVRDEKTGEPVPRVHIIFAAPGNNYTNGTWPRTYSDDNGRYSAGPFIPNKYEVLLWGCAGLTRKPFTLASLQDMQNVDFKIEHHMQLTGIVTNADGEPVPGASVLSVGKRGHITFDVTDDNGRFALSAGASAQPVYLQASHAGLLSPLVGPARDGAECRLPLQPAARIQGVVVNTAGEPQHGMTVVAVPSQTELNTIFTPTGLSWGPDIETGGTSAETTPSGVFHIAPVLPGPYELQVYAQSSPVGYPAATAKASVTAGQTLHARLVLDSRAFGNAEGRVIVNGTPLPGVFVGANCDDEKWLGNVMANTDADGAYQLASLRPGNIRIRIRARVDKIRWDREQEVTIAAGQTARVDFEVGETGCGFDGFITFGTAPALARVVFFPAGSTEKTGNYETDLRGYYRAADLQEGQYDIEVQDLFYPQKVYAAANAVQARANEVVRLDFTAGAGSIEGAVDRLRQGEVAHVAIFPETADFSNISAALTGQIIASTTITAGDSFRFDDIPVGVYYIGAVAVPADKTDDEPTLLAQIEKGKYAMSPVEVVSGETATINLTLP